MSITNQGHPLWLTAFRPFFLVGSLYFTLAIIAWLANLSSLFKLPPGTSGIAWHAYEMVFGFARAIIIGFLFTAAQNWTGRKLITPRGLQLMLAAWLLGRLAFFLSEAGRTLAFSLDTLLNIAITIILFRFFFVRGQNHNRIIAVTYAAFFFCQLTTQLSLEGYFLPGKVFHFLHAGLYLCVIFVIIIAGRIIPFFTRVVLPQAGARRVEPLEKIITWGSLALLGLVFYQPGAGWQTYLACSYLVVLAGLHFIRWILWRPWKSTPRPILAILHFAYLWIILSFVAYALSMLGTVPNSFVWHSFGLGAMATFILGMITRVSLGHTGRPIVASGDVITSYFLLTLAVFLRISVPWWPVALWGYLASGTLAALAFFFFFARFYKILISARPDGKES